jgi:transcriptional regulator with XRE-family HTH domain
MQRRLVLCARVVKPSVPLVLQLCEPLLRCHDGHGAARAWADLEYERGPTVVSDGDLVSVEQPEGPDENDVQRKMQKLFTVWPMKPAELKGKVDKISREAGSTGKAGISLSYIYQLLNGTRKDLGRDKAAFIAAAFGVDAAYFGPHKKLVDRIDQQLDRILEIRATPEGAEMERLAHDEVRVAARTSVLSADSRATYAEIRELVMRQHELQMGVE